ncbi:MAG: hypothetical protein M3411_04785, partial [Chloroflexota bacterium]|nr:hypothetical protein [Chloroflexota bacterium]
SSLRRASVKQKVPLVLSLALVRGHDGVTRCIQPGIAPEAEAIPEKQPSPPPQPRPIPPPPSSPPAVSAATMRGPGRRLVIVAGRRSLDPR